MSLNDNDYWDKKWKLFDVYYVYKVPRKKMKIKILFVLFLSTVSAQTLSVDEAVRIALENKSAITNAEKDVRIAQLSRNSSAALLLPSISASNSFRESTYGNSIIQDQNHILEVSTYLKVYLILEEKLILFVKAIILIKSLKFRREKQHLE